MYNKLLVEKSNSLIEIIQICLKIYLYNHIDHSWCAQGRVSCPTDLYPYNTEVFTCVIQLIRRGTTSQQ